MSPKSPLKQPTGLFRVLSWIVTITIPIILVLTAVRIMMTPAYLIFEYNTPKFPPDRFGFNKQDRLYWSRFALDYLLNDEDISYLRELRFPEGQAVPPQSCVFMDDCTRFYNDSELQHMVDVKNVVQAALNVWYVSIAILVVLGIWARFGNWWSGFKHGVRRGGWMTVILLGAILLFVFVAFGIIFVAFHQVFFEAGTWTFLFSDSLIRLFPERFWRDTFLWVGLLSGGAGLALGLLLKE
jgi:integral membrane protein (TIGR01906 family)